MPLHEIIGAAKELAADLKAATTFVNSVIALIIVAKSTVSMLGKEKSFAF